ncbi:MAG TPA: threonine aldolase [Planctomycetaceae bacterium]|nr:threonine aldolase [Planctomycetaceae bacterium]
MSAASAAANLSSSVDPWSRVPSDPRAWRGIDQVPSPALLVVSELLDENIAKMIAIAGGPNRLRPHCKTHKCAAVIARELSAGIDKHKCATIAEAEMLAAAGVRDVFLAYPPVGPNIARTIRLAEVFPETTWRVSADHPQPLEELAAAARAAGRTIGVLVDLDPGMHRTGLPIGERAAELYRRCATLDGVRADGFQLYDGHHRQLDPSERMGAVRQVWDQAASLADRLTAEGYDVPRIVAGGTGSFPCFAAIDDKRLELSPGTVVFHDAGYLSAFPDLPFVPAALLLTRVISFPGEHRVTTDLGHKGVAADPAAGKRVRFPAIPDAREVMHSEEHLVIETSLAETLRPGDPLLAVPTHICPTTALHQEVIVIRDGAVAERWPIDCRARRLTI